MTPYFSGLDLKFLVLAVWPSDCLPLEGSPVSIFSLLTWHPRLLEQLKYCTTYHLLNRERPVALKHSKLPSQFVSEAQRWLEADRLGCPAGKSVDRAEQRVVP